jgi:hypothetical protein
MGAGPDKRDGSIFFFLWYIHTFVYNGAVGGRDRKSREGEMMMMNDE